MFLEKTDFVTVESYGQASVQVFLVYSVLIHNTYYFKTEYMVIEYTLRNILHNWQVTIRVGVGKTKNKWRSGYLFKLVIIPLVILGLLSISSVASLLQSSVTLTGFGTISASAPSIYLTADTPSYNSTLPNSPCVFSTHWNTNRALNYYWMQDNITGTMVNEVAIAFNSSISSVTKTLPSNGTVVQFKFFAALTDGTFASSDSMYFTAYSITAKSGSAADIQTAVNYVATHAPNGMGTVQIPAGNFSFCQNGNWPTVYVPVGVWLRGATPNGNDSMGIPTSWNTILTMQYPAGINELQGVQGTSYPVWFVLGAHRSNDYWGWGQGTVGTDESAERNNKTIHFSNIELQGYRTFNETAGADVLGKTESIGISVQGVLNYRIDHTCLENLGGGGIDVSIYYANNVYSCGVIDHNRIYNTAGISNNANLVLGNVGYGISVGRATYPGYVQYYTAETLLGHYTNITHFVEYNYLSMWRHDIAQGHGGYYVARYNLFDYDFYNGVTTDVHGKRDIDSGGNTYSGGQGAELYENTYQNMTNAGSPGNPDVDLQGIFVVRGGVGAFFNNYVDTTYANMFMDVYDSERSASWDMQNWAFWSAKGTLGTDINVAVTNIDPVAITALNNYRNFTRDAGSYGDANYPNSPPNIAWYKPYPIPMYIDLS